MECSKSELNKLIHWSSSRYNEMKKSEVINDIIFRIEKGEDCTVEYRSGCYSESAHNNKFNCRWTGGSYTLEIKDGEARLKNYTSDIRITNKEEVIIVRPCKYKLYTPATKIKITGNPVGTKCWYKDNLDVIGKEFEVINQSIENFEINFNGFKGYIRKSDSIITKSGLEITPNNICERIEAAKLKSLAAVKNPRNIETKSLEGDI